MFNLYHSHIIISNHIILYKFYISLYIVNKKRYINIDLWTSMVHGHNQNQNPQNIFVGVGSKARNQTGGTKGSYKSISTFLLWSLAHLMPFGINQLAYKQHKYSCTIEGPVIIALYSTNCTNLHCCITTA